MLADGTNLKLYLVSLITGMLAQMFTMLLDANCVQDVKLIISSSPCWLFGRYRDSVAPPPTNAQILATNDITGRRLQRISMLWSLRKQEVANRPFNSHLVT